MEQWVLCLPFLFKNHDNCNLILSKYDKIQSKELWAFSIHINKVCDYCILKTATKWISEHLLFNIKARDR